jgi:thiamine-monophosphate kinase
MSRRFTEDELISRLFAPLAAEAGLGLKDDAALLPLGGAKIVATVDALVAGVHFFPHDPPDAIARKALRVNLSDLAAKGAEPKGFLLAIALPSDWTNDWLAAFAAGLAQDAKAFNCPLLGGDTVATPGPLTISITALGEAPQGRFVARTGAKVGDALYVSGTIGDAALGLALRRDENLTRRLLPQAREFLLDRYLLPQPRLALAAALRNHASAAMDISDGLAGDLLKLARASNAAARVWLERIPLSPSAQEVIALAPNLVDLVATGGDDYEILCCAQAGATELSAQAEACGAPLTRIGEIIAGEAQAVFLEAGGKQKHFNRMSYSHF